METESATLRRALDALNSICRTSPERDDQRPESDAAGPTQRTPARLHSRAKAETRGSIPPHDLARWYVNGERATVFPHCPRCASYALYRENNLGNFECQTCGLQGIEESLARRVQ